MKDSIKIWHRKNIKTMQIRFKYNYRTFGSFDFHCILSIEVRIITYVIVIMSIALLRCNTFPMKCGWFLFSGVRFFFHSLFLGSSMSNKIFSPFAWILLLCHFDSLPFLRMIGNSSKKANGKCEGMQFNFYLKFLYIHARLCGVFVCCFFFVCRTQLLLHLFLFNSTPTVLILNTNKRCILFSVFTIWF